MQNTVVIGKRLVPLEQVAMVEPVDPVGLAKLQTDRPFQARLVLIDRESVLTEEAVAGFALTHGFRVLAEDGIATNPAVHFRVEAFEPMEGFTPTKPYQTRLLWRDPDGQAQSKLLVTAPEDVLATVVRGNSGPSNASVPAVRKVRRLQASSLRPK